MATNIGNIGRWQMAGNNIKMDNTTVIPPTLGQSAGELIINKLEGRDHGALNF